MLLFSRKVSIGLIFLAFMPNLWSDSRKIAFDYIHQYKNIAIAEMYRTGIPASIKLAQGILESNMGRSELATQANNHFGIKCGSRWNGGTYHLKDDDRNRHGKLIKSCFRTFASVEESYVAHSEFLLGSPSGRYDFLFEYDPKDYKSWARGLRKAGYATDKRYPKKLINVIEKYELYQFDNHEPVQYVYEDIDRSMPIDNTETSKPQSSRIKKEYKVFSSSVKRGDYKVNSINRLNYVEAAGGESLAQLATKVGLSTKILMEYNEDLGYEELILDAGDIVYLQRKEKSYRGPKEYHIVEEGENMYRVAQLYGIRLNNLYAKNRMPLGSEPLTGERLYLKKSAPRGERPEYIKKSDLKSEEPELLFADETGIK